VTTTMGVSRVGHSIEWSDVASGDLVRAVPETGFVWHYVRLEEHGACVGCSTERSGSWGYMVGTELPRWDEWGPRDDGARHVTVIAEGMTGDETGAQLRSIAQAYDAKREADLAAFEARQNELSLRLMCL